MIFRPMLALMVVRDVLKFTIIENHVIGSSPCINIIGFVSCSKGFKTDFIFTVGSRPLLVIF